MSPPTPWQTSGSATSPWLIFSTSKGSDGVGAGGESDDSDVLAMDDELAEGSWLEPNDCRTDREGNRSSGIPVDVGMGSESDCPSAIPRRE